MHTRQDEQRGQRQCAGTNRAGERCRSFARRDSDFCNLHSADLNASELGRSGGLEKADNRAVRERLADAAAEDYELIRHALREAIDTEVTRWGDCPNCKHRVPVAFPDINARMKAINTWLDQGFGKPRETKDVGVEARPALAAELTDEQLLVALTEPVELECDPK